MRRVLVDSGPLYALFDPNDARHERAQEESERLEAAGVESIAPFPILYEAHSLVMRKLGSTAAAHWFQATEPLVGLLNPKHSHCLAATRRLSMFPDQSITMFDALLAELADHLELPVWTYDHHFDMMQVEVWR